MTKRAEADTVGAAPLAVLVGLLLVPFSAAVTLALGYSCRWFLIPVLPFGMVLFEYGLIRERGVLAVGSTQLSMILYWVLTSKRRAFVITIAALVQAAGAVWALALR